MYHLCKEKNGILKKKKNILWFDLFQGWAKTCPSGTTSLPKQTLQWQEDKNPSPIHFILTKRKWHKCIFISKWCALKKMSKEKVVVAWTLINMENVNQVF